MLAFERNQTRAVKKRRDRFKVCDVSEPDDSAVYFCPTPTAGARLPKLVQQSWARLSWASNTVS